MSTRAAFTLTHVTFRFLVVVVASTVNACALACAMHRRRGWAGEGQPRGIAVDAVQLAFLEPLLCTSNRSMEALLPPCLSHWRQTLVQHYQLLTDGRFLSMSKGCCTRHDRVAGTHEAESADSSGIEPACTLRVMALWCIEKSQMAAQALMAQIFVGQRRQGIRRHI